MGSNSSKTKTIIEDPAIRGRVLGVNRARFNEFPFFLLNNGPANTNAVSVSANRASAPQLLSVSNEGPVIVHALAHQKTDEMTCMLQIMDGTTPTSLMNNAIHVDCIFGSRGQPLYLPEALMIDNGRALVARFTDISGANNEIWPAAFGAKYTKVINDPTLKMARKRFQNRQYLTMPYFYTITPTNSAGDTVGASVLSALGTNYEEINISQEHNFELMAMSYVSTDPQININIVEAESGESLFDAPADANYAVSAELVMGTGNFPFRFHEPRIFRSGTKLNVTLTDRSNAENAVFLCLIGRSIIKRMWNSAA